MREYINLVMEKQDDRDMVAKLRDLIDHPSTEPFLREVAQRKLDKILGAQAAEQAAAEKHRDDTQNLPALNISINVSRGALNLSPLPRDKWGEIYLAGNGKRLTFQTVLDRALPLRPFRVDFYVRGNDAVGPHVDLWFYPEDEPENGQAIEKFLNAGGSIWAGVPDGDGHYLRGGQSRYFVSFSRYTRPRR